MPELKTLFKLNPTLAIKYLKNKENAFSWDWYDIWQEAHNKTFAVAKVVRKEILNDIRSSVDKALEEGKTFHEFQKELKPILQKKVGGASRLLSILKATQKKYNSVQCID